MIDAGARSQKAIREILATAACDIINQHPCQQAGLGRAISIAHCAQIMGTATAVGGTGFLGVGTAAYQHVAAVIGLDFPCGELGGLFDHGFEDDIVAEPLPVQKGQAPLSNLPGSGVTIDEASLQRLVLQERRYP